MFNTLKAIKNANIWHTIDPIEAPAILIVGLLTNIIFNIVFATTPPPSAATGTFGKFNPYNPPLTVWFNAVNIIDIDDNCSINAPSDADG